MLHLDLSWDFFLSTLLMALAAHENRHQRGLLFHYHSTLTHMQGLCHPTSFHFNAKLYAQNLRKVSVRN